MPYDSGYTSAGDRDYRFVQSYETISPERFIVTPLGKFDFWLHYLFDGLYIDFYSKFLKMLLYFLKMQYFTRSFWILKDIQSFLCFGNYIYQSGRYIFKSSQQYMFLCLSRWIFVLSTVGFVVSLVGKSLLGLIPEHFLKFDVFPVIPVFLL